MKFYKFYLLQRVWQYTYMEFNVMILAESWPWAWAMSMSESGSRNDERAYSHGPSSQTTPSLRSHRVSHRSARESSQILNDSRATICLYLWALWYFVCKYDQASGNSMFIFMSLVITDDLFIFSCFQTIALSEMIFWYCGSKDFLFLYWHFVFC